MRDVDLKTLKEIERLWTEVGTEGTPKPNPARRMAARARALNAFEKTHRRGIGAAIARHFVKSSAPAWHLIGETLDSPWMDTVLRLTTSLIALAVFSAAVIAMFLLGG